MYDAHKIIPEISAKVIPVLVCFKLQYAQKDFVKNARRLDRWITEAVML